MKIKTVIAIFILFKSISYEEISGTILNKSNEKFFVKTAITNSTNEDNLFPSVYETYIQNNKKKPLNQTKQDNQAEVKVKVKERVTSQDFIIKNDIMYLPNEDKPYTGIYETFYNNGNKMGVAHIKDSKFDGLMTLWDESGQHKTEKMIRNGIITCVRVNLNA